MPSYFARGRHRKPTRTARQAAAITIAATTVGFALTGQGTAHAADRWDALIQCESGGNPRAQNPHSSASGLFQFIDSTWKAFGGLEFANRAKDASADEQYKVAERAFAAQGYGPWAASKSCWSGKVDPDGPKQEKSEPKPTPAQAPEPAPEPEPTPVAAPTATAPTPPPAETPAPELGASPAPEVDPVPVGPLQLGGTVPAVHQYTVQPGDTLWGIAGPGWLAAYERNHGLIGDDPDLIHPGQVLDL